MKGHVLPDHTVLPSEGTARRHEGTRRFASCVGPPRLHFHFQHFVIGVGIGIMRGVEAATAVFLFLFQRHVSLLQLGGDLVRGGREWLRGWRRRWRREVPGRLWAGDSQDVSAWSVKVRRCCTCTWAFLKTYVVSRGARFSVSFATLYLKPQLNYASIKLCRLT